MPAYDYRQQNDKKCTEYINFYMCIKDTIYFHPDFSYPL